ncbi:diacylglycerol kinase [uncultured Clostridium sp.]|uniref:diacylglycerol kinase n=1 Tax=uncultured Clostridium sp. TaxID=59620 RepID=UPI00262059D6|nr:diacylglycerol kinase [uncultured Clostridium sp.]
MKKLLDSFNFAINGIIYALRTQRNMRIHFGIALIVLFATFFYNISKLEFIALSICITLVVVAELINTAIESVIDLSTNHYHPLAKIAKDTAAGAVFLTALNAILVGYIVFGDKITQITYELVTKIKDKDHFLIFIVIMIVAILTVIAKAIWGEGTPLQGGMPSGHSAIAFSVATCISMISNEPIVYMLSYFMALITAQSRVDSKVHTVNEVIVGAILGISVTVVIFKIFN